MAAALAAGVLACAATAADADAKVTLAIVPTETSVADLAALGLSPAVLSAGIGEVSAAQTYEDISAGNRESPPSDAMPGLLGTTLAEAGLPMSTFRTVHAGTGELADLAGGLRGDDLLLAMAAPPPGENRGLAFGIAGDGFGGNLTSDSTRTDGYVISTDIAPTVLERLGVSVPDEMNGEPIRSEGEIDFEAVEDRGDRMEAIPERRAPVVIACLLAWIAIAAVVSVLAGRWRSVALRWLALAFAYMPLMLLAGAALEPGAVAEGLLIGVGAAGLAALTLSLAPGWWSLSIACGATVASYAIDVIAGSNLTVLSLLGPNPIYGARFYGIGNELEALIAVMVPAGVGAALTAMAREGREIDRGPAVGAFAAVAAVGVLIFATGRFGADVGAAIVLPVGAAVAIAMLSSPTRSRVLSAAIAAPFVAVAALVVIDLVSGGDAHLTRSVIDAGGAGDLADVVERRIRLSAEDFSEAAGNPLFWLVAAGIGFAIARRRTIDLWLRPSPVFRAGFIGASAAVGVGVLVNDSGATFLVLGGLGVGACLAFAWAQASPQTAKKTT